MKKAVFPFICLLTFGVMSCDRVPTSAGRAVSLEVVYSDIIDIANTEHGFILVDSTYTCYELDGENVRLLKYKSPQYFYRNKTSAPFAAELDFNTYIYLCNAPRCYYVCYYDKSYSSRFLALNSHTLKEDFFGYIKGVPGGMYVYDNKLWYLSGIKDGGLDSYSVLRSYNIETGITELEIAMPAINGKGLYINDAIFTVFDRNTKSLCSFTIDENSQSISILN